MCCSNLYVVLDRQSRAMLLLNSAEHVTILERVTRQVFVMSFLFATCAEKGWKLVGEEARITRWAANLDRSSFRRISRGAEGKRTNAGHDPTTTSFTELSAERRFPANRVGRTKRAKKQRREKKNIEREKEKEYRRIEGWENRYIEQRTRWLMIRILASTTTRASSIFYQHFYFPTYSRFSRKRSCTASSVSDLPIRKREHVALFAFAKQKRTYDMLSNRVESSCVKNHERFSTSPLQHQSCYTEKIRNFQNSWSSEL